MTNSLSIQSPEEFRLIGVTLTTDRLTRSIDLKNVTIEFNIFEDIRKPYLTGSLIVLDDNQLYDSISIQGTERINIIVSLGEQTQQIEKNFVITNVNKTIKTNDYSAVLQFDLLEDIGYLNNIQKFSRVYDGKGEQIIEKLIKDYIRKPIANIDRQLNYNTFQSSHQSAFRLITPYITAFNAIQLVLDKISTTNGMPYYLYSTLVDDNLFLADLETIMLRAPFNQNRPFVYSQSQTNSANSRGLEQQSYSIYNLANPNIDDTLLLAEYGAIRSVYSIIDATTGQTKTYQNLLTETIGQLKSNGVIDQNDVVPIDQQFIPDPSGNNQSNLEQYMSRHFDEIAGSTYEYSIDIKNWTEEAEGDYYLRAQKFALKQLMLKNTQRITVPGFWFLGKNSKTSVGNQIEINVFKNDPEAAARRGDILDTKKSGNFVIMAKRHTFNATEYKHLCTIECVRLTHPQVIR